MSGGQRAVYGPVVGISVPLSKIPGFFAAK